MNIKNTKVTIRSSIGVYLDFMFIRPILVLVVSYLNQIPRQKKKILAYKHPERRLPRTAGLTLTQSRHAESLENQLIRYLCSTQQQASLFRKNQGSISIT